MALTFISQEGRPNFIALSSDIVDNKIDGATQVGRFVYTTDDKKMYIIKEDNTLAIISIPALIII